MSEKDEVFEDDEAVADEAAAEEWLEAADAADADEAPDESDESDDADESHILTLDDGPEDVDGSEKVFDLPAEQADDIHAIAEMDDPQAQLDAYREAGFPERLLEVITAHDGRVVRVRNLVLGD